MTRIFVKRCLVFFLFSICMLASFGQNTAKEITDKFFEIYSKDPGKAIDYIFSTNKWTSRKPDAIEDLRNKLKNSRIYVETITASSY